MGLKIARNCRLNLHEHCQPAFKCVCDRITPQAVLPFHSATDSRAPFVAYSRASIPVFLHFESVPRYLLFVRTTPTAPLLLLAVMARKKKTPPDSSPRRSRRAALRTVSKVATLSQRRTHFERVVQHHVAQRKSNTPAELWKLDQSVLSDSVPSLDPDDVENLLNDPPSAPHKLCALLLRLRKVTNDASDAEDSTEMRDDDGEGEKDNNDELSESELADLPNLAQVLANDSFISHESDEIRLFTACALAEILRISAPKAPLSDNKLKAVCNLFIDELTVIAFAEDHLKSFRFALLEQLATVKTFAIFSEEEHVVADIFACFYASVRPHQAEKYKEHLGFILVTLLTEVDTIDQTLLDALLAPLAQDPSEQSANSLKSLSGYSASAVQLASYVLVAAKNQLQVPICNFFNSALHKLSKGRLLPEKRGPGRPRKTKEEPTIDDDDPDYENLDSDLSEDIENLVVTVNQIAPSMLIYVIPSLEERLRAKDSVVRRNVAHLLGKLFMSSSATVSAYPSVFTEFLHRARDIEPVLRAEVCKTLGPLIVTNPRQRATLNKALHDRVLDQSETVREVVAISVGKTESYASSELIAALSTRLRDRKQSVRHETFRQLASLYKTQLKNVRERPESSLSDPLTEASTLADTQEEVSEQNDKMVPKLNLPRPLKPRRKDGVIPLWMAELPNHLLASHQLLQNTDDLILLDDIEKFVFEEMISWDTTSSSSDELRVSKFAAFIGNLNEQSIVHFNAMVSRRGRIVKALKRICNIRLKEKHEEGQNQDIPDTEVPGSVVGTPIRAVKRTFAKKSKESSSLGGENVAPLGLDGELQTASNTLSSLLGRRKFRNEDSLALCLRLCNVADRRFFEQLNTALSQTVSSEEALAASQDAVSRVSSKSVLGEFMGTVVFPAARLLLFSVSHLEAAFAIVSRYNARVQESAKVHIDQPTFLDGIPENSFVGDNDVMCGILRYIELTSLHFPQMLKGEKTNPYDMVCQSNHESPYSLQVLVGGLKVMSRIEWTDLTDEQRNPLIEQLHKIMVAPVEIDAKVSSYMAKWATRALVQVCKGFSSSDEVWERTLNLLVKELEENINNAKFLLSPYSSLVQLAKHAGSVFKTVYVRVLDHARLLMFGQYNENLRTNLTLDGEEEVDETADGKVSPFRAFWKSSFAPICGTSRMVCDDPILDLYVACLAELCTRAVKLMVYCVHAADLDEDEVIEIMKLLKYGAEIKRGDVFDLRLKFEDEDGQEVEDPSDAHQNPSFVSAWNVIRLACCSGMLYLARSPRYFKAVNPTDINWALHCTSDPRAEVRIAFARDLNRYVVRKGLPFRWISALALMAVDPEKENLSEVRTMLTTSLRRKRNHIRSRLQNNPSTLRKLLPEVTMPVLIWLIAHHPDAANPDEEVKRDYNLGSEKLMEFLLDRLLDSNEYAAVIHEYLDALAVAKDIGDDEDEISEVTKRIHTLARTCSVLLKKKQAGRKWNLLEHPGIVALPGDLFQKGATNEENSAAPPQSLLDAAKQFDADVGEAEKKTPKSAMEESPARRRSRATPQKKSTDSAKKETPKRSVEESPARRRGRPTSDKGTLAREQKKGPGSAVKKSPGRPRRQPIMEMDSPEQTPKKSPRSAKKETPARRRTRSTSEKESPEQPKTKTPQSAAKKGAGRKRTRSILGSREQEEVESSEQKPEESPVRRRTRSTVQENGSGPGEEEETSQSAVKKTPTRRRTRSILTQGTPEQKKPETPQPAAEESPVSRETRSDSKKRQKTSSTPEKRGRKKSEVQTPESAMEESPARRRTRSSSRKRQRVSNVSK